MTLNNLFLKITVSALFALFYACETTQPKTTAPSTSSEKAPYAGYKLPGMTPEVFVARSSTSADWTLGNVDSLDMQEFYFTYSGSNPFEPAVVVYRQEESYYTASKYTFLPASTENPDKLYSRHNYIERTNSGWSKLKSLGPMIDSEDWGIMVLSVSDSGTMVFDDYKRDVIRISRIKDGKREAPTLLGPQINTGKWTAHPFIAPDESFLIWGSEREDGYGMSDNYISFRQPDGSWGRAINMGDEINSPLVENGARLTPDGKYLLFGRSEELENGDGSTYWETTTYWVDAAIIERLRPQL